MRAPIECDDVLYEDSDKEQFDDYELNQGKKLFETMRKENQGPPSEPFRSPNQRRIKGSRILRKLFSMRLKLYHFMNDWFI